MTDAPVVHARVPDRIQNYNAPHFQVMPPQISGAMAQAKAKIDNAARALPWHYFVIITLLIAECAAWWIDFHMLFNFRATSVVDPNTGLLPESRYWEVFAMALQGLFVGLFTYKILMKTKWGRFGVSAAIVIMMLVFSLAIAFVSATGELPRYLGILNGFLSSQNASWAPQSSAIKAMAGIDSLYQIALYLTALPFVMIPMISGWMAHYLEASFREAFSIRKAWTTFTTRYREVETLNLEALEEFWRAESMKRDFKPAMMLPVSTEIATALAKIQKLNEELTASETYQYDPNAQIFLSAWGKKFIQGAEGLVNGTIKDPQRIWELIEQAREILNDDFDLKVYEAWSRKSGINGLD